MDLRGLSQHERSAHPVLRNNKRKLAAQPMAHRPKAKGYGKTWTQQEIENMLQLEVRLRGQLQIAKQMEQHLPRKTGKQIRDKRREPTYHRLLQETLDEHTDALPEGDSDSRAQSVELDFLSNHSIICPESEKPMVISEDIASGPTIPNGSSDMVSNHNVDCGDASDDLNDKTDTPKDTSASANTPEVPGGWYESTINGVLESMEVSTSGVNPKLKRHFASLLKMAKIDEKSVTQTTIDNVYKEIRAGFGQLSSK
jgi:hypothetical protein